MGVFVGPMAGPSRLHQITDNMLHYLMALGIALRARCVNCIVGQTMRALDAGATKEEILETISVNMAMSGTTGVAESLRVLKLLDELEIEK